MILHILLKEGSDQESLRATVQVVQQSVQFLTESLLGAAQIRVARGTRDVVIRFYLVVVLGLSNEGPLELVLVELLGCGRDVLRLVVNLLSGATAQLNQHLNGEAQRGDLDDASITLLGDL